MTGFYDEDGMYIHESGDDDDLIQRLIQDIKDGMSLMQESRELLILNGYDPDTGEYIDD